MRPSRVSPGAGQTRRGRKAPARKKTADGETDLILQHWREAVPNDRLAHLVKDATRALLRALQARLAVHGVSLGHWTFLRVLWEKDGITQRELSERVGMREPTTVVALKGLEKAGFITRTKTAEDRRKTFIYLTPHAKKLELILAPLNAEVHKVATRGMTDEEVETLRLLMRRVVENLADETAKLSTLSDVKA